MKRVLVSFVGMVDPFTVRDIKDKNTGEVIDTLKRDGSLTHIMRHYKKENKPIDKVYIYYSKEMFEYKDSIDLAVKHFFPNIDIINLPKDEKNLRINVNKYGTFYPIISEIFEEIKKEYLYEKYCEIIINISSGTPAMQTDLSLIAITHNLPENFRVKMLQVNSPFKKSNNQREKYELDELQIQFKEVDEQESHNEDRTEEEKINDTRKLILIEGIENSLKKDDYAGIYDVIKTNKDMFKNPKLLLYYSQNLYYRNIGDEKSAKEGIPDEILKDLYIIKDKDISSIIERINMLNTKDSRDEINDWLLLAQTVVEDIYEQMLLKICNFNIREILENEKISLEKFNKINTNNKYENILNIISTSNGRFVDAFLLKKILMSYKPKIGPDGMTVIIVLDKIRTFRNVSAHSNEFITRKKLDMGFEKKIEDEARYQRTATTRLVAYPNNAIKEVNYKFKNILSRIVSEEDEKNMNDALKMYDNIKDKILEILGNEIKQKQEI